MKPEENKVLKSKSRIQTLVWHGPDFLPPDLECLLFKVINKFDAKFIYVIGSYCTKENEYRLHVAPNLDGRLPAGENKFFKISEWARLKV